MTDLIESISAKSSESSFEKSSKVAPNSAFRRVYGNRACQITPMVSLKSSLAGLLRSDDVKDASGEVLYENMCPQASLLFQSTEMLARGTAQHFPPAVSEYVLTFCALRTLTLYEHILLSSKVSPNSGDRNGVSDNKI